MANARLLELLADGQFHSGEQLAETLGMTRSAVWKRIRALRALGLDVYRVPGRGYRLRDGLELLDAARIRQHLPSDLAARLAALEVHDSVDSTNAVLLRRDGPGKPEVCLAEHQSAGRGRRGRRWASPFGANLYLSLSWTFAELPRDFPALALVVGLAAADALATSGVPGVALKWPNDLQHGGAKLGGILLEMRGEPPGPCRVVIGIGINVRMPPAFAAAIDQSWTDLAQATGGAVPSRNALAAAVITTVIRALERFEREGFAPFHPAWTKRDALRGRVVTVEGGAGTPFSGEALGIDADGALLVRCGAAVRRVVAADVSVRSVA
ncbi:MAG TPA: bifunctional biotin--[acetyl-CoA-carboxylase] ligase/biotin operon repressor BirA [Gammaproteobacteria bacterium]|nr:bifunctional biotin--[acetyl-CoA-carboxylase] ligase/biotin operon repressor BirA [Gammaproteobacteria bacterium]